MMKRPPNFTTSIKRKKSRIDWKRNCSTTKLCCLETKFDKPMLQSEIHSRVDFKAKQRSPPKHARMKTTMGERKRGRKGACSNRAEYWCATNNNNMQRHSVGGASNTNGSCFWQLTKWVHVKLITNVRPQTHARRKVRVAFCCVCLRWHIRNFILPPTRAVRDVIKYWLRLCCAGGGVGGLLQPISYLSPKNWRAIIFDALYKSRRLTSN